MPKAAATEEASVEWKRFASGELALSPDGAALAYVTVAPRLATNQNEWTLRVQPLAGARGTRIADSVRVNVSSDSYFASTRVTGNLNVPLGHVQWLADSRSIIFKRQPHWNTDYSEICLLDVQTGHVRVLQEFAAAVQEMSVSADGDTAAFFLIHPQDPVRKQEMEDYGLSIDQRLFVSQLNNRTWQRPRRQIVLVEHLSSARPVHTVIEDYQDLLERLSSYTPNLSLSPDGHHLVYARAVSELPAPWRSIRKLQQLGNDRSWVRPYDAGLNLELTAYGVADRRKRLAFDHPNFVSEQVAWSEDSAWFAVHESPNLYGVRVETLTRVLIASPEQAAFADDPYTRASTGTVLRWTDRGRELTLRSGVKSLQTLRFANGRWQVVSTTELPVTGAAYWFGELRVGAAGIAARLESSQVPPDLYFWPAGTEAQPPQRITTLNPQLADLSLGAVEKRSIQNRYGARSVSYLIRPPDYSPGARYPAVIMLKDWTDMFILDGQWYSTGFPVQRLASSGFVIVLAAAPDWRAEPQIGPGKMGYNFNELATVEAVIDQLAASGMVNMERVGIAGFSVTSWQTQFVLTQSGFPFAAAVTSDAFNLNYVSYATQNLHGNPQSYDMGRAFDYLYDGPPYGKTLRHWLDFAPAFNSWKVTAPVLIESCSSNLNLAPALEWFTSLHKLGKPTDLYLYPNGQHLLQRPRERLASLRLSADWFEFWLKNTESDAPSYDTGRFERWRKLREQHESNAQAIRAGKDPVELYQTKLREEGWLPPAVP